MSFEKHIFTVGDHYRTKANFVSGATTFIADETLIFDHESFSRYDDCFLYVFHGQTTGERKVWWLHINEPPESWRQYFEPVGK